MASAALVVSVLFQPWIGVPAALAEADPVAAQPENKANEHEAFLASASEAAKLLTNPALAVSRALEVGKGADATDGDGGGVPAPQPDAQTGGAEAPPATPADVTPEREAHAPPTATAAPPTATAAPPTATPIPLDGSGSSGATSDLSTPQRFIAAVVPPAQDSQRETGVPASVTIAQAILESNWGKSGLSVKAQNYFGIKAISGPGPAGVISMDTWEVFGGVDTVIRDAFKAYHSLHESVVDHGRFLAGNPRYAAAFKTDDPKEFARRIHDAGYATDPDYCAKLGSLIDSYRLDQYDLKE